MLFHRSLDLSIVSEARVSHTIWLNGHAHCDLLLTHHLAWLHHGHLLLLTRHLAWLHHDHLLLLTRYLLLVWCHHVLTWLHLVHTWLLLHLVGHGKLASLLTLFLLFLLLLVRFLLLLLPAVVDDFEADERDRDVDSSPDDDDCEQQGFDRVLVVFFPIAA